MEMCKNHGNSEIDGFVGHTGDVVATRDMR